MEGFAALGPLPYRVVAKVRDAKQRAPKLTCASSLSQDKPAGTKAGQVQGEHSRRELLALGIFLTAAARAPDALAGQSNGQLADEVRLFFFASGRKGAGL